MRLTVIESPFGKNVDGSTADEPTIARNVRYLKRCIADSFARGEAPYASHGLYPGVLNDAVYEQRRLGMYAGFAWGEKADVRAVYIDHGITPGMAQGIDRGRALGQTIEHRTIGKEGGDGDRGAKNSVGRVVE